MTLLEVIQGGFGPVQELFQPFAVRLEAESQTLNVFEVSGCKLSRDNVAPL